MIITKHQSFSQSAIERDYIHTEHGREEQKKQPLKVRNPPSECLSNQLTVIGRDGKEERWRRRQQQPENEHTKGNRTEIEK